MSIIDTIIRASKEIETAKKLDELNHTIRSSVWLIFFTLIHSLDGELTINEMIAAAIGMYLWMAVTSVISFFWYHVKLGYVRGMKNREDAKKLKVTRNA